MGDASDAPTAGISSDGRLDSWKEIAHYLKRDVTTVQRWEKREGMPVHRHVHDKLGSVYAFRSELDSWAQRRNLRLTPEGLKPESLQDVPAGSTADLDAAARTLDPVVSGDSPARPRRG